ncbi:ABC transporter ATP-binding protein [Streptococcus sp. E17BB]|uniref:ABC transporter ATP-binding protein n=1 Tax=Streptococcus sp. E17BB TaxID=3278714 RepID=UPI00359F044E
MDSQKASLNFWVLFKILGLFALQAFLLSSGTYFMALNGENIAETKRQELTRHLMHLPLSFFHYEKSGELSSRVVNDINNLGNFYVTTLPSLITSSVTIIGSVIVLFLLDWKLTLTFFIALPLLVLLLFPLSQLSQNSSEQLQEDTSRLIGQLSETFKEIELIKADNGENQRLNHLNAIITKIKQTSLKVDLIKSFISPVGLMFLFASIALIFTYGGQRVATGDLTIGTLISFLVYLFQLLNPVGAIGTIVTDFAKVKGATKELDRLLTIEQEDFSQKRNTIPKGNLVLEEVSFGYQADQDTLSHINMILPLGQKIALVGPSGSGKSTLAHLLARFYQPTSGVIKLADQDISSFSLKDWRQGLALVSQSAAVLSGSLRDNLTFGLNTTPSETDIEQALKAAVLWEDVQKLEQGLDTFVGEGGKLLSGGQKQRLQIAKAYLKQAHLIIFDEATANLDADAEFAIGQSMKQLLHNKTALVIAHRLSTILDADHIYFLENGQLTGSGSHNDLLANHSTYARFVKEQLLMD